MRALLHVKWASLLQKAGKYDRAEEHWAGGQLRADETREPLETKRGVLENQPFTLMLFPLRHIRTSFTGDFRAI